MVGPPLMALLLIPGLANAQSLVDRGTISRALARFSGHVGETPLGCQVTPIKPTVNFSFRVQAGYTFRVSLNQFSGPNHSLTVVTRITSEASPQPVFLMDTLRLPSVPPTDQEAEVGGGFFVGEGHYRVNWMLIDDLGRTCHKDWPLVVELARGDRPVKLVMPANTVAEISLRASPAADRHPDAVAPLKLTVLLDAAPLSAGSTIRSTLSSSDQVFLLGVLSALIERVPATSVRLVAFNLEQQKELFRRDGFTLDSLNELAMSLNQLQLATVDYQVLRFRTGYLELLARLINQELRAQPISDAVIFLGPRERFHERLPADALDKSVSAPRFFFLPYEAPRALPDPESPRALPGPMGALGGRGGARGGSSPSVSINSAPDMMSGPPSGSGDYALNDAVRSSFPDSPEGLADTVSLAVARLKGKTIAIQSPSQFAKAIEQIERRNSR